MSIKHHFPTISIVVVVYNAVRTLEGTILSIVKQLNENIEFVIVDGGSTDGTLEIIKKYSEAITLWISEPDKGIYDAMNKSVNLCKGKYMYFIGADDIFMDGVGKKILPYLIDEKVVYGNVRFKSRDTLYDGPFDKLKIATRNISHQAIFYPRIVFSTYQFNTDYKIFADYDLNLKLFNNRGFRFKYVPITVALFNDLGSSGSNVPDLNFEEDRARIIKENFPYWVYLYRIIRTQFVKSFIKHE